MTAPPRSRAPHVPDGMLDALLIGLCALAGLAVTLWAGGAVAVLFSGHLPPQASILSGLRTLAHPNDPSNAWHTVMPGPVLYWTCTAVVVAITGALTGITLFYLRRGANARQTDPRRAAGLADRAEIRRVASAKMLRRRGSTVRPSLKSARPDEVGYRLGRARGTDVWACVEDSIIVLGPPRSGKGLHLVIPMILDSPGAVITTSTRPDNLAVTMRARRRRGPVAVFDPQHLAPGAPDSIRWSPIRGCDEPQTAMIRGRALAASSADRVDNAGFWLAQTEAAIRAFLHAAALDERTAGDLYRWSLDPVAAAEAVAILYADPHAATGWADALDAIIHGDPRTRDNSWAGIRVALSPLADPRVLATVSPEPAAQLDPAAFLRENGAIYLLGTATGVGAATGLIAALVEDVVESARHNAAASAGARLDPPLALVLDEAANYVLPSLPALMSDGGGTGLTTIAVLQSLAQARARWGEHDAAAIWDAAIVKLILGGGTNARDLADLSALIGDRDEITVNHSRDGAGQRSSSTSIRRVPVLDTGRLRTLPFGTSIALMRTARPIAVDLQPWTKRPDRIALTADRRQVEGP